MILSTKQYVKTLSVKTFIKSPFRDTHWDLTWWGKYHTKSKSNMRKEKSSFESEVFFVVDKECNISKKWLSHIFFLTLFRLFCFLFQPPREQTRKKSVLMLSIETDTFFKHILGFSHELDIQTNRERRERERGEEVT